MANGSLDVVLQSMRDLGQGVSALGAGVAQGEANRQRRDEAERKADADRIRQERLGELAATVEDINEAAQDESFDQRAFATAAKPVIEGSLELGDPSILRSLDPIQEIISQREQSRRATIASESAEQKAERQRREKSEETERAGRKEIREIKKSYLNDDVTKKTTLLRSSYKQIRGLADKEPSAAGDISLIFSYMRMNDPTSTVREGEYATAENARGVSESLRTVYNKLVDGQRLTPKQREDFKSTAETIYASQLEQQREVDQRTLEELGEIKADRKKVIPRLAEEDLAELAAQRKAKAAKKKDEELSIQSSDPDTSLKLIDEAAADAIMKEPANVQRFMAIVEAENARRAAAGREPVSQSEKNTWIIEFLKRKGYSLAPGAK